MVNQHLTDSLENPKVEEVEFIGSMVTNELPDFVTFEEELSASEESSIVEYVRSYW